MNVKLDISEDDKHPILSELKNEFDKIPKDILSNTLIKTPSGKCSITSLVYQGYLTDFIVRNLKLIENASPYYADKPHSNNYVWFFDFANKLSKDPKTPSCILDAMAPLKNADYIRLEINPAATREHLTTRYETLLNDEFKDEDNAILNYRLSEFIKIASAHPNFSGPTTNPLELNFELNEVCEAFKKETLNFEAAIKFITKFATEELIKLKSRNLENKTSLISSLYHGLSFNPSLTDKQYQTIFYSLITHLPLSSSNHAINTPLRTLLSNPNFSHAGVFELLSIDDKKIDFQFLPAKRFRRLIAQSRKKLIDEECTSPGTTPGQTPGFLKKPMALSNLITEGYAITPLMQTKTTKDYLNLLIGSSHKEEVLLADNAVLFSTKAFTALQSLFTNPNTKVLSHDQYISFLTMLNEKGINLSSFELLPEALIFAYEKLGKDLFYSIFDNSPCWGDVRTAFSSLYTFTHHFSEKENEHHTAIIDEWLKEANFSLDRLLTLTSCNGATKNTDINPRFIVLDQQKLFRNTDKCEQVIRENEEYKHWAFYAPNNQKELRQLGWLHNITLGGDHYLNAYKNGQAIIFSIFPNGEIKKGYSFLFSSDGELIHGVGYGGKSVNKTASKLAMNLFDAFTKKQQ